MISGQIYPSKPPQCEFVSDSNTWSVLPDNRIFLSLPVNAEMYRRKVWFSFGYSGAVDASFVIDGEVRFSYRGERIFALPVQYNARTGVTNGSDCDVYWSTLSDVIQPSNPILNDEPLVGEVGTLHLGACPFRGTFVCDKIEFVASRLSLGGANLVAFLACQSEYPY
jgi:hypothetical protein